MARVVLLPPLLGLLCTGLALTMPEDRVWPHAAQAVLLSLPRWLLLLWPLGALGLVFRDRIYVVPGLLALAGLGLAGVPSWPVTGPGRVLVSANVQAFAEGGDGLEEALGALEADVLFTLERRAHAVEGMVRVADNYARPLDRDSHGTAVFCRVGLPCEALVTEEFGSRSSVMPLALLRLDGVCMMGVHGPPPAPLDATGLMPYVRRIADALSEGRMARDWGPCQEGDPALVVGDLNAVPGSRAHQLLQGRGLTDHLQSQGVWASTWPAGGGWPNLPVLRLDHLLAGQVQVEGVETLRIPGSDHKALRALVQTGVMLQDAKENR